MRFHWNSEKGFDRELLKEFDKAMENNRQKAIDRENKKEPVHQPKLDIEKLPEANQALSEGKGFYYEKD